MMLLPLLLALANTPFAEEVDFYIGTYTSKEGSRGIYRSRLNTRTGALSEPILAAEAASPSFLALHPNGRFLYAVHETTGGDVSAYAIGDDKNLRLLNTESSKGGGPCHLTVDPTGKNVLTAAYGGGSFACLPIRPDGSLAPVSSFFQNTGSGPDKGRQEGPHGHAIYADAKSRFVYACDLGTDEVLTFRFDPSKGELTLAEPRSTKTPAGGGPRHLALHPKRKFAYVNNEMGNSVTAYAVDEKTGSMRELQTIPTLPEGEKKPGRSTAEIILHPNGRWLYVSNRGHDSIAAYAIGRDGKLTLLEIESAGVKEPRGFDVDPSGKWLVVGGQNSNDLTALAIDPATGKLQPGTARVAVGKPVCVVFAKP
jgi:6-phosphogluconolactonase